MLDFERLEKKCKRYRFKKFLYFIIPVFLVVSLGFLVYEFLPIQVFKQNKRVMKKIDNETVQKKNTTIKKPFIKKTHHQSQKLDKKNISKSKENKKQLNQSKTKKNSKIEQKQKCYALQFSSSNMKFIYYANKRKSVLEKHGFNCYIKHSKIDKNRIYLRCNKTNSYNKLTKYIDLAKKSGFSYFIVNEECDENLVKKDKDVAIKKSKIIKKEKTKQDKIDSKKEIKDYLSVKPISIKELENLFKSRKTYSLAIKISQRYFEKKDFKNSLKWAKIANGIDNEDEKSWMLYARSLYNLGDKKSAIEILKVFLQYKNSTDAKILLERWAKK